MVVCTFPARSACHQSAPGAPLFWLLRASVANEVRHRLTDAKTCFALCQFSRARTSRPVARGRKSAGAWGDVDNGARVIFRYKRDINFKVASNSSL